jgi:hypothetical protein
MKLRRVFAHGPALALFIALPLAAAGAGVGCAKVAPPSSEVAVTNDAGGTTANPDGGSSSILPPSEIGPDLLVTPGLCVDAGAPSVGESPLRRISRIEYDNMVRDLLNDNTAPAAQFVSESPMSPGVNFDVNTYTLVTSTLIPQQYLQAAETLAANAVATTNALTNLLNTVPGGMCGQQNDACGQAFIDYFANKAFRGQYDSTESAALFQIFSDTEAQFDFPTGIQAVITTVLTSPRFLFVFEFGAASSSGAVVALSPYEVAARLAFFLWRSVPDDALMQAAAGNQLGTPDQIEAQATRMLADPKATSAIRDFTEQWMELQSTDGVTKDTQFTNWTAQLASDLKEETLQTVTNETLTENGGQGSSLTELLTSGQSYINADVAALYGVPSPGGDGGTSFTKTSVNPTSLSSPIRAGILTNGSVLATQAHTTLTSPVLRGKLVREQVLCDPVPPPPVGGVDGMAIPPPPAVLPAGSTTRDAFEQHLTNTVCNGCHLQMDPIGFGFGNFDATGAYQATDSNGSTGGTYPAIDASGTINAATPSETMINFNGPVDLATKLAGDSRVSECFALQQFRYSLGRMETVQDACSAQQMYQAFTASNLNLQTVITAIVRMDSFRYRNAETAGSECK